MNKELDHSCSYYCELPECIKAQRDELRDRIERPGFVLVPAKVTDAMIDAANNVPSGFAGSPPHWQWVWDAMIAAATSHKP